MTQSNLVYCRVERQKSGVRYAHHSAVGWADEEE